MVWRRGRDQLESFAAYERHRAHAHCGGHAQAPQRPVAVAEHTHREGRFDRWKLLSWWWGRKVGYLLGVEPGRWPRCTRGSCEAGFGCWWGWSMSFDSETSSPTSRAPQHFAGFLVLGPSPNRRARPLVRSRRQLKPPPPSPAPSLVPCPAQSTKQSQRLLRRARAPQR